MILNSLLEIDIMQIFIWVLLSPFFYVVCYLAVLNIIDDFTKDSFLKIPFFLIAAFPAAFLMAVLNYRHPIFLIALSCVANFYRVQERLRQKVDHGLKRPSNLSPGLFFCASYLYLTVLCILAYYFQIPVEFGENAVPIPMWKTWIPEALESPVP